MGEGDRLRLQQIAWNILNNAVKFTPSGGRIEIALNNEGERAAFVVTDTGQGIDPGFLPHVFEMFRQADGSNRRRHGGMGIGLALVRQLVQLHGGTISAESDGPNRGSRFTVRLPLLRETAPLAVSAPAAAELNVFSHTSFLILDDSEDSIAMMKELLKLAGAEVVTATSGVDALRIASENEFDVILSDISMPEMDGFEFLERLRKIDGRQDVPVIAMTGTFCRPSIFRNRSRNSNPSISGIEMSERITSKSFSLAIRKASTPFVAVTTFAPASLSNSSIIPIESSESSRTRKLVCENTSS